MTLVSEIITDAYRQSNILAIGTSPTTAQSTEALRYLNRIVESIFGKEVGENLEEFPVGDNNVEEFYMDPTLFQDFLYIPKNKRLMCNLTEAVTVNLHPSPDDGCRIGVSDISNNLSTFNLTINGNGRTIEDASSLVLNTDGINQEWFYRADLGNWVKLTNLIATDTFPFPIAFDIVFITMLAMYLNPSYGATITPDTNAMYTRQKNQMQARYATSKEIPTNEALTRLPLTSIDRRYYHSNTYMDSETAFNRGWIW